ncbi:MAG: 30S ribosomal protein S12 methylthiotransferase RimO [Deltaproteobacteria bacterium]|nr:30S ribosomal protein S12 methylthiotransferase RimO [Deltaproteobacteria bacterium]
MVDAEVMAALISKSGYNITPLAHEADVILINTCAFILPAKEESIEEILRAAEGKKGKESSCSRLIVTGCLPQRYGRILEHELPEVDLFIGVGEVPNIAQHLDSLIFKEARGPRSIISKPSFLMDARSPRLLTTPLHTAYLKIAEGCSNRCSYCVIPVIRGRSRSRQIDDILTEAEILVSGGVKEIIITAQDTTAYGRDLKGKPTLNDILRKLATIRGIQWIRLLYTHPAGLTDDILKTIADEERICNYIDIPIQHIDDEILAAMKRRSKSDLISKTLQKARELIPGVALRTSIIVGFPGETRTKFNRLLSFVREIRFDHLGVFTYSREEGTKAASYPSRISEREKETRKQVIMEEQAFVSYTINQSLIGSTQEVLIEEKSEMSDFPYIGRCRRQAPDIDGITYVKGKNLTIGKIIPCTITGANDYDLFAEVVTP